LSVNVYFSIGDAIAGLGIFLLIPQYLKPIYVFRLRVLGMGLHVLYALPALGFVVILIAAVVPNLPESVPVLIRTPLVWEMLAAFLWATSYGVLGWVSIVPAHPGPRSIAGYVRAGVNLLAGASEEDRVEFAGDIVASIKRLIRIADVADGPGHADERDAAGFSETFLRILSDPVFCKTLVARLPWDAARILNAFSEAQPKHKVGRAFVLQIARQTLISSESDDPKDQDFHGFTDAPPLLKAAFGDAYLNRMYLPWEGIVASDFDDIGIDKMRRVSIAAKLTIDEQAAGGFAAQSYNIARLQENLEIIGRRIAVLKHSDADVSQLAGLLGQAVKHIVEATCRYCAAASAAERRVLYADDDSIRDFSAIDSVAELVVSVLETTSREFAGFDDKFWRMAREIWDAVFPRFGARPAGMDPLQQRVAMKLIEKIHESMEGWYSPLLRLTLALVGPYAAKGETKERTAFKILRDALYTELMAFPAFYEIDPERAKSVLPGNVRYDPDTSELIHRYSFGGEDRTNLKGLEIGAVSFTPDEAWLGGAQADERSVPASTRYE
jgi:hypothetical protein